MKMLCMTLYFYEPLLSLGWDQSWPLYSAGAFLRWADQDTREDNPPLFVLPTSICEKKIPFKK